LPERQNQGIDARLLSGLRDLAQSYELAAPTVALDACRPFFSGPDSTIRACPVLDA
jgi:hypothetical protein